MQKIIMKTFIHISYIYRAFENINSIEWNEKSFSTYAL